MSDPVIRVEHLTKAYRLGVINHGTLRHDLESWWARLRGKDDPHTKLGSENKSSPIGTFLALDNISFDVQRGETLGIIGCNGAGKSTLLKILSRITDPTSGRIRLKGRVASLLEVGTGFHPELTGRENVFLNGAVLGMTKAEIVRCFDEILAFSGVEKFIDTPVKRYSSGMYVRLAFAVAAHLEPEILIVDEVLAVGDAEFQKKCLGKMAEVGRAGRTVLFVSHNMNAVNRLCQRAILLCDGRIVDHGPTENITFRYLQQGGGEEHASADFPDDPANPHQVLSVRLTHADGRPLDRPLQVHEPFAVHLVYRCREPLPGGYAVLLLKNHLGEIVMLSDNRDSKDSVSLEGKGTTSLEVVFPAPLLTPGSYTISASVARPPLGTINVREHAVSFKVVDTDGIRQSRSGTIYQPLIWRSEG
ncbi:ABC transporter ATP-binding protein [Desulfuromonas sp. TF]|uniref:ABC transporter ATP-binding protein n=1 Tax=Desulfuromonas sp. TF TaxID=1232410 RepID=UPI0004073121|nr:ABC transporter ATP-binding protein [Desulfuromonas sp. TF]